MSSPTPSSKREWPELSVAYFQTQREYRARPLGQQGRVFGWNDSYPAETYLPASAVQGLVEALEKIGASQTEYGFGPETRTVHPFGALAASRANAALRAFKAVKG